VNFLLWREANPAHSGPAEKSNDVRRERGKNLQKLKKRIETKKKESKGEEERRVGKKKRGGNGRPAFYSEELKT